MVGLARSQEAFAAKEVAALNAQIRALERRLAFTSSSVPEGMPFSSTFLSSAFMGWIVVVAFVLIDSPVSVADVSEHLFGCAYFPTSSK